MMKNIFLISLVLLSLVACSSSTPLMITPQASPTFILQIPSPTALESPAKIREAGGLTPTVTKTQSIEINEISETVASPQNVEGIILFIGDGMGANYRTGAQWLAYGKSGQLVMDSLPVFGSAETSAANTKITESAAAATAIATGIKTNYEVVGMDVDSNAIPTILEQAQALGWSVGLVTTVQLAHATPAAFAAHTPNRNNMLTIAQQIYEHGVDVLLGGGEDDFIPSDQKGCYSDLGHRWDGRNLIEEAVADGYTYVCTAEQLAAVDLLATDKLIGIFGDEEISIPYAPSLAEMTEAAIEILSRNPNGFFLMVEGGQIDWEGHENKAELALQLTVGLDAAVTVGTIHALAHPNTLLIVTADHETGGMSLNLTGEGSFRQDGPLAMPDGTPFWVDWFGGSHTAENVPVTAQGPWSELLYGEYPNTWIYRVMYAAMTGEMK